MREGVTAALVSKSEGYFILTSIVGNQLQLYVVFQQVRGALKT